MQSAIGGQLGAVPAIHSAASGESLASHGNALPPGFHAITFTVDTTASALTSYSDQHLAQLWHIGQANPAAYGDADAGAFAEKVGREIIRRWLAGVPPELWNHQGRDYFRQVFTRGQVATEGAAIKSAAHLSNVG